MTKTSGVQKWALAVAIAIVFNLFVNYGIATFYPGPEYNDFCTERARIEPLGRSAECGPVNASEELQQECIGKEGYIAYEYDTNGCAVQGTAYCETCNREFDDARKDYNGIIFFVLVLIGIAAIAAGVFIKVQSIGIGLLLAGILSIIIGAIRAWDQLQDVARFVLLGVALIALLWLGYKKVKE